MIRYVFAALLMAGLAAPARVAGSDELLSVRTAIAMAEANNPQLNQLRQQLRARRATRGAALGIENPRLSYFREGIPDGQTSSFSERRLAISQRLDFPLTGILRRSRLGLEASELEAQVEATRLQVVAGVKRAYTKLAYFLEVQHLGGEQLRLAEELHNAAATRVEVGEASDLDLMRAEMQLAEARNSLAAAQRDLHGARYELFAIIGLDPASQSYTIQFPDTLVYFDVTIDQDRALHQLERHPEMIGAARALAAANAGVREAWSQLLPALDFSYYRQDFGGGFDYHGFEAGLEVPLWFWLNEKNRLQQAKALHSERQWQRNGTYLTLKQQAENAWHGYEASREIILRQHQVMRVNATDIVRLTLEGYRAGELDILALLEAQRTYLGNERNYLEALRDYYLYLIDLERFVGSEIIFAAPANP